MNASESSRRWYQLLGPGLITACVVIGPGSILTSSQVGAKYGYDRSWIVAVAVVFMMVFTMMGAKLGAVRSESNGELVTQRAGRWLAVLIGLGVFFISAAFQFGNNLGVHSAFNIYLEQLDLSAEATRNLGIAVIVGFNAVAISFLFAFRNLYRVVERLMMTFVGAMLLAFALNLAFARPHLLRLAAGFIPTMDRTMDISVLGLVGTTFVITAAYFQSYLVQQKGWTKGEVKQGLLDARVGAVIMALITIMIMSTAATVMPGATLKNMSDVAGQLGPLFGGWGEPIFCLGLFSAAYSSFLVNSMIGGFILSDGLGLGSRTTDRGPRVLTTVVLLTGMLVAIYVIRSGQSPVAAIVFAQAVTVIASPLMAITLLWLTSSREVMGDDRNRMATQILGWVGFGLLAAMAYYTAFYKVIPAILAAPK